MNEVIARPRTEVPLIRIIRRALVAYTALAAISLKSALAYITASWLEFGLQFIWMVAFIYFWRAVYMGQQTLAGLELRQTLDYVILATTLMPLVETPFIVVFGYWLREGQVAMELVRPVDFQTNVYLAQLTGLLSSLLQKVPLLLFAWFFFGLRLPSDPLIWLAFAVSLLLGHAIFFCFGWTFACLAFYTTETWGLYKLQVGLARLSSGALVPLTMMPGWLQAVCQSLPFAQVIFVPIALLTGITPLSQAPQVWAVQVLWLIGLLVFSRLIFNIALRQVTIQGG